MLSFTRRIGVNAMIYKIKIKLIPKPNIQETIKSGDNVYVKIQDKEWCLERWINRIKSFVFEEKR